MVLVYVLNKHGNPLMPCKASKARKLLKENKAKVVNRTPFTIQLLYGSSGYKQPTTLGVDAGSKNVGLSVTTDKQELFSAEVLLRDDIVEKLSTRREMRRTRRNRKTRYRKCRINNRKNKKKGWLPPSTLIHQYLCVTGSKRKEQYDEYHKSRYQIIHPNQFGYKTTGRKCVC